MRELFTLDDMEHLFDFYHMNVVRHDSMSGVPCGEECSAFSFFEWMRASDSTVEKFLNNEVR